MKKYALNQLQSDPRTIGRMTWTVIRCIDAGTTSLGEIFTAIDHAYSSGPHRSPSYIKKEKKRAVRLLAMLDSGSSEKESNG